MALWLQEGQRVKVSKNGLRDEGKYATLNFSSSRKDGENWVYSSWGFAKIVGKAYQFVQAHNVGDDDVLVIKKAFLTRESYVKQGEDKKSWAASPQMVILDLEIYRSNNSGKKPKASENVELPPDDDIPF